MQRQALLQAVEFMTREAMRGDRLGMRMAGSALPERVKRMLTGVAAARSSRWRAVVTCLLAVAAGSLLATGTLARAQRIKIVSVAPPMKAAATTAFEASKESKESKLASPVLVAQAVSPAKGPLTDTALPAAPPPAFEDLRFEVATVKPSGPPSKTGDLLAQHTATMAITTGGPGTATPERITITQTPLRMLLWTGFGVRPDQISGPGWLDTEKFDITANVPPGATKEQAAVMLRNLLVERFKITLHHTQGQNVKAYQLTVAKNGSKLKEVEPIPQSPPQQSRRTFTEIVALLQPPVDSEGFPIVPEGQSGIRSTRAQDLTRITCRACSIGDLVRPLTTDLAITVGEPVIALAAADIVDGTGLTGKYDIRLEFSAGAGAGGALKPPSVEIASGPDLFGALEKQLGLKLEKAKVMHDVLVIDQIERVPTEN